MNEFIASLLLKNIKELEKEQLVNISDPEKALLENSPLPKGGELQQRFFSPRYWKEVVTKQK